MFNLNNSSNIYFWIKKNKVKAMFSIYIILFIIISITCILKYQSKNNILVNQIDNIGIQNEVNNNSKVEIYSESVNKFYTKNIIGYLTIPKINLNEIVILDGTNLEVLDKAIGHFEESSYINGNVCFAAHSFGAKVNYFENLYKLKKNDVIYYDTKVDMKIYKVAEKKEIDETNVKILNNTNENILTLITCIKSKRAKRLCIIAKQIS